MQWHSFEAEDKSLLWDSQNSCHPTQSVKDMSALVHPQHAGFVVIVLRSERLSNVHHWRLCVLWFDVIRFDRGALPSVRNLVILWMESNPFQYLLELLGRRLVLEMDTRYLYLKRNKMTGSYCCRDDFGVAPQLLMILYLWKSWAYHCMNVSNSRLMLRCVMILHLWQL